MNKFTFAKLSNTQILGFKGLKGAVNKVIHY